MGVYVIGDVHGCVKTLAALIDQFEVRSNDEIWFCGDLVNRGPSSANCIRFISSLKIKTVSVLGNHDLYFLNICKDNPKSIADKGLCSILEASDKLDLIDWLRNRPMAHVEKNNILVHAGIYPSWDTKKIKLLSEEVCKELKSHNWQTFLSNMWGNYPNKWNDNLKNFDRKRAIVNIFTRMRYISRDGYLDFLLKKAPSKKIDGYSPWFNHESFKTRKERIIFGHWSSLGLLIRKNIISLDTGCVWGGLLTAVRLGDCKIYSQKLID